MAAADPWAPRGSIDIDIDPWTPRSSVGMVETALSFPVADDPFAGEPFLPAASADPALRTQAKPHAAFGSLSGFARWAAADDDDDEDDSAAEDAQLTTQAPPTLTRSPAPDSIMVLDAGLLGDAEC